MKLIQKEIISNNKSTVNNDGISIYKYNYEDSQKVIFSEFHLFGKIKRNDYENAKL